MSIEQDFTLCSGGGECIGVSPGADEGRVLLSFSTGAVQLHDVHECRLVCDWQLPHSELLACPAVVDSTSKCYWAVSSKLSVLQWEEKTTPTISHQLKSSPVKLLVTNGNHKPLVVYGDGGVESVAGAGGGLGGLISLAPHEGRASWHVVMGGVYGGGAEVCVVCVRARSIAVGVASLTATDGGCVVMERSCVGVVRKKTDLKSCCICGDQLWMLSGEGQLLQLHLQRPLDNLQVVHTLPSPSSFSHIMSLSADFFILGHAYSLQLWDTHYCTCQSSKTISCTGSKLWCEEGCVWGGATGLQGWQVHVGVASLAAALGRRKSQSSSLPIVVTSWPTSNKELLHWDGGGASTEAAAAMADLVNPDKTATLQAFQELFEHVQLDREVCWRGVTDRLLGETRFWPRQPLIQLLEAGLVPRDVDVVSAAVAREDWDLVMTCLTSGATPTETCLVDTLQHAFSLPEVVECEDQVILKEDIILKLLQRPFTDVLLQPALAALTLSTVKELLAFLCSHIGVVFLLAPPSSSECCYEHLLSWVGVVLDVHFTRLLLDASCRDVLLSLRANVLAQVRCYDYLSSLSSLCQMHPSWQKSRQQDWLYKEEELVFHFD